MSLIGNIARVPLFTTIEEALAWGSENGLSGYHQHVLQGEQGYMGGVNHAQAISVTELGRNVGGTTMPERNTNNSSSSY